MTKNHQTNSSDNPFTVLIKDAVKIATEFPGAITGQLSEATASIQKSVSPKIYDFIERGTETTGRVVTPIAENPVVKYATKLPVISWLMAAVGQVNGEKVQQDVETLKQKYPLENYEQLANRVIMEATFNAATIGMITNIAPPVALMLIPLDLTAIAALQAEMIYRIAAIYGFPTQDSTRRGEVLLIWGLSAGGSSLLKTGLSVIELLPFIGTVIGITSDAAILFSLAQVACLFYQEKRRLEEIKPITLPIS